MDNLICRVHRNPNGTFAVFRDEHEAEKNKHLFKCECFACFGGYMNALKLKEKKNDKDQTRGKEQTS